MASNEPPSTVIAPSPSTGPPRSPPTTMSNPDTTSQSKRTLRISTRSSALALAQVSIFTSLLQSHPSPSISSTPTTTHPITTSLGDTNKTTDLHTLASSTGGKSLWTEDLEEELCKGRVDILVHSLKDVPTLVRRGCCVRSVGARGEARDCVVLRKGHVLLSTDDTDDRERQGEEGKKTPLLDRLQPGAVIGTSSIRRAAMIRRRYPHLIIKDMRGNVGTRLRKLDDPSLGYDALVLAGAGVQRLGLDERVSGWLGKEEGVLHAVGQGAVGVEWREDDEWVGGLVDALSGGLDHITTAAEDDALAEARRRDRHVRWECIAERSLLRTVEGGCSVPLGVDCTWQDEDEEDTQLNPEQQHQPSPHPSSPTPNPHPESNPRNRAALLTMEAMVVSIDGKQCVQAQWQSRISNDAEAEECGWRMARVLVEKGAGDILREITLNRTIIGESGGA